jgi:hypothetical protein
MSGTRRWLTGALVPLLAVAGAGPLPARADLSDESALAARFAPIVRLVEQPEACGPGEPYEPTDVDVLFDEPTVALRGPRNAADLVKIGPSVDDVAGRYEYHLDFPGAPLTPGCDYERWARRLTAGTRPTVYSHVASEAGRGSWHCSIGCSIRSTTSTICTRATGR